MAIEFGPKAVTTIKPLDDKAKDAAFSLSLIQAWFGGKTGLPDAVTVSLKDHFTAVSVGLDYWRAMYYEAMDQLQQSNDRYNELTAMSANMLQKIQTLEDQNEELLKDQQREFHARKDNEG